MNILLCMPKFIDTNHPGCNGGGAWGWMLEKQFNKLGWNVTFYNSFEPNLIPKEILEKQDIAIFRHSYQVEFRRYKDIVSKVKPGTLIVHNYIDKDATEDWESFRVCKETDIWLAQNERHRKLAEDVGYESWVLHYPIDMKKFSSQPRKNKKLLYVGRFCPQKGIESLIEAFRIIRKKYLDATLTIKGAWSWGEWGDRGSSGFKNYVEDMESRISDIGGINIINKWTSPDSVSKIYNEHSILIFPVNAEGYGAPTVEAQSASMPVITSDHDSQIEKVSEHIDGFCLKRSWLDPTLNRYLLPDPNDIAHKVDFFFRDMDRIGLFGKRAREKAKDNYDEDIVITKLATYLIKEFTEKKIKHV